MKSKISFHLSMLLLVVGATRQFDLTLIARVPLSEIIAFGSLPFLLRSLPLGRFQHRIFPVLAVLGLWALGILISDYLNGFVPQLFIRGIAKPIWCLLWFFFFIGILLRDFRALLFYPLGSFLASLQNYFFPQAWTVDRIEGSVYEAVAYGLGPVLAATALVLAVYLYKKHKLLSASVFLVYGMILVLVDAPRSSLGIAFLNTGIMLYMYWVHRPGQRPIRLSPARLVVLSMLGLFLMVAIFEGYSFGAAVGWFGEFQQSKMLGQSDTIFGDSFLGLIMDGRTAVFGAILAIIDNPFIGYGSWRAWTLSEYYYAAIEYVGTDARELTSLANSTDLVSPGHSIFFTAWMENGILVAITLGIIFYFIIREFLFTIQRDGRLAPLLIVFTTSFAWAFLFSPFGTAHRMVIGLFLALHVLKINKLKI